MVKCEFKTIDKYWCSIYKQAIPSEVDVKTFEGVHEKHRTNDDVQEIHIYCSTCPEIPDKLGEVFKNVTYLAITYSELKEISKKKLKQFPNLEHLCLRSNKLEVISRDLFEFNRKLKKINLSENKIRRIESGLLDELQNLEEFSIYKNQIEFVPGDFFMFNKKIKEISFGCNKIKFIGPELLDGLEDLEGIEFVSNPSIDVRYYKQRDSLRKLNEIKQEIKSLQDLLQEIFENSKRIHQKIPPKRPKIIEKSSKAIQTEDVVICAPYDRHSDLENFLKIEHFKDFTVRIDSTDFKLHKFLLAARSETFVERIKQEPNLTEWKLDGIAVEAFEVVLKFLYTDETPKDSKNAREIFSAASILKIKKLKEIYAKILSDTIEKNQDFRELWEIYKLGVKYKENKLKEKAFEKIKKFFPNNEMKDEYLNWA